ncbi:hypothetical protein P5G60_24100 [Paenibacillus jamilae]|nr:hypothetical protein [Paenibacillus jamilae]
MGDDTMGKEKSFKLNFVQVEDRSEHIIRSLVKTELLKVMAKHGVVSYNLDEVLSKYITGEMCNEEKG